MVRASHPPIYYYRSVIYKQRKIIVSQSNPPPWLPHNIVFTDRANEEIQFAPEISWGAATAEHFLIGGGGGERTLKTLIETKHLQMVLFKHSFHSH